MLAVAQRDIFFPANHCSLGMTLDQNNPSDKVCCISAFLVTTQEVNPLSCLVLSSVGRQLRENMHGFHRV